ncbi:DUF1830 domain-containing protein [Nodosilinea nodulosa]|uniref:DUF1830 domain-containing protein n=1 Tax=Nodosilinea nodulosa TaxID=416001 RepID=UPI0008FB8F11|nr:DUF1830 domain-containing protein [Nodosilinea nodulosa]
MTYLLSLLTPELPTQSSFPILCYYINNTASVQNVRVMRGAACYLERIIFMKERVLFEAFPESYLEVYSQRRNRSRLDKIDCKLLQVNQAEESAQKPRQ